MPSKKSIAPARISITPAKAIHPVPSSRVVDDAADMERSFRSLRLARARDARLRPPSIRAVFATSYILPRAAALLRSTSQVADRLPAAAVSLEPERHG